MSSTNYKAVMRKELHFENILEGISSENEYKIGTVESNGFYRLSLQGSSDWFIDAEIFNGEIKKISSYNSGSSKTFNLVVKNKEIMFRISNTTSENISLDIEFDSALFTLDTKENTATINYDSYNFGVVYFKDNVEIDGDTTFSTIKTNKVILSTAIETPAIENVEKVYFKKTESDTTFWVAEVDTTNENAEIKIYQDTSND